VTSNNCLDFADPDDDADTGIFRRKFYHCEIGNFFYKFCCIVKRRDYFPWRRFAVSPTAYGY